MKKLYRLYTSIALILLPALGIAQCSPNNSIYAANDYLYPQTIPFATANVDYSQVLTFRVPKDSVIDQSGFTISLHIDSAQLIYISGIPDGYGYQCNTPQCTWNGGSLGCALISGIADESKIGEYPMMVYVYTWAQLGDQEPYTPYTRIDSSAYTFKILATTGLFEIEPYAQLKAYPNPVTDVLNIEVDDIKGNNNSIEVFDATGKKVFEKAFLKPNTYQYIEQISLSQLPNGLYFVVLKADEKTSLQKILHN